MVVLTLTPFLLFVGKQRGKAEEAVSFYVSPLRNSKIDKIDRCGPGEVEREGTVRHAAFTLNGQKFMALDSGLDRRFTFTPAMSVFVTCETKSEIDELFGRLSDGGKIHMPLSK